MGKASDWLREERRKVLGDWVAVCLGCGFAQRFFEDWESDLPAACPQCGGEIRSRCPKSCCSSHASSVIIAGCFSRASTPSPALSIT